MIPRSTRQRIETAAQLSNVFLVPIHKGEQPDELLAIGSNLRLQTKVMRLGKGNLYDAVLFEKTNQPELFQL